MQIASHLSSYMPPQLLKILASSIIFTMVAGCSLEAIHRSHVEDFYKKCQEIAKSGGLPEGDCEKEARELDRTFSHARAEGDRNRRAKQEAFDRSDTKQTLVAIQNSIVTAGNMYTSNKIAQAQQNEARANIGKSDIKLLENWNKVTTSAVLGSPIIEVCIRDHECEDGDILSVAVNGRVVAKRELYKSWYCTRTSVTSGNNSVQILAVNGTGNKGNCSYSNVNTGEISVHGINSDGSKKSGQTQSWKLNAGAGSTSSVEVQVQ